MKILQINAVNGIRSTGQITTEIADFIAEKEHESYIAYSEGDKYHNGFMIGTKFEKKIHAFLSRLTGLQ